MLAALGAGLVATSATAAPRGSAPERKVSEKPAIIAMYRAKPARATAKPSVAQASNAQRSLALPGVWTDNPTDAGAASGLRTSEALGGTVARTFAAADGIRSDEFNAAALDTSVWTFVDPIGDSTLTMTGSQARIAVPAGSRHDLWANANEVPRLRQVAPNTDFEVEVKFDSSVAVGYQLQGVVVEQDAQNQIGRAHV